MLLVVNFFPASVSVGGGVSLGVFYEGIKHLVDFLGFFSKQNSKPKKQDCMQTYVSLSIEISVRQLA